MKQFILILLLLATAFGARSAHADKYALLIGIDQYRESDRINSLSAAGADAVALGKTLVDVAGFPADHVRVLTSNGDSQPTRDQILFELDLLTREVKAGDLVFVFYSGHGWNPKDSNVSYLLPYDTNASSEYMLKKTTIPTTDFVEALQHLPAQAVVMAFDMCRNNPFKEQSRAIGTTETLGAQQARDLTLVPSAAPNGLHAAVTLFSCSVDQKSWEWDAKKRGFFSYYLEQALRNNPNGASVADVVRYVEKQVPAAVEREENEAQTPWSEIKGNDALDLMLTPRQSTFPVNPQPIPDPVLIGTSAKLKVETTPPGATVFVDGVEKGKTPCEIEVDLGINRTKPAEVGITLNGYKTRVADVTLERGMSTPLNVTLEAVSAPLTPPSDGELKIGSSKINPKDGAEMVWVPAGPFTMGSTDADNQAVPDEKPAHTVTLDGYWIYKNDVTVAEYKAFCAATGHAMPSLGDGFSGDDHPIVKVTWDDAQAYCAWAGVKLPTEAQWEKAARGTDGRIYPWGNDFNAGLLNCNNNLKSTSSVGSYGGGTSSYGCLDMAGNVFQWCSDWYGKDYYSVSPSSNPLGPGFGTGRVLRGGSWADNSDNCRSASRYYDTPSLDLYDLGFRCVSPGR